MIWRKLRQSTKIEGSLVRVAILVDNDKHYFNGYYRELTIISEEVAEKVRHHNNRYGTPMYAYQRGNRVRIFPIPDKNMKIRIRTVSYKEI